MNFRNNGASSSSDPGSEQTQGSTNDLSQQLIQQLQLAMQQQQQPQNQLNQQPLMANNNLAFSLLLGNPLVALSLPAAASAATGTSIMNPSQQLALLALQQLSGAANVPGVAALPVIPNPVVSNPPPVANANINYLQLFSLAQQLQQQQQQQLISQLMFSSAAATAVNGTNAPLAPLRSQLGTMASAIGHQAPAAAPTEALEASPSAVASSHPQPRHPSKERKEKSLKQTPVMNSSPISPSGRPPISLTTDYDSRSLNPYQCLLRQQIELFETGESTGVEGCSQGRNAQIQIGQVGIRCRFCARLPNKSRPKGAVYYSKSVRGIYQTSQNMAHVHFAERCKTIPNDIREKLKRLYGTSRRATAGKDYWEECLRAQGVYEDGQTLRFRPLPDSTMAKKKSK